MSKVLYFAVFFLFLHSCEDNSSAFDQIESLENKRVNTEIEEGKAENDTTFQSTNWYFYEGRIGNYQQQIVMELGISGNQVSGRYFYARHQKFLDLNGVIDTISDTLRLAETHLGNITGYLTFKKDSLGLHGYWQTTLNDAHQFFEAQPISINLGKRDQMAVGFVKYSHPKEVEMYNGMDKKTNRENTIDELALSKIDKKHFAFYYHVFGPNGHTGVLDGIATVIDKDYAIYQHEDCLLSFKIYTDSIVVEEEEDCSLHRGVRASFNNSLKKDPINN